MSDIVNQELLTSSILEDRPTTFVNAALRGHLARYRFRTFYTVEQGKEIWIWKGFIEAECEILVPDLHYSSSTFTSEYAALSHALEMIKHYKLSPIVQKPVPNSQDTWFY